MESVVFFCNSSVRVVKWSRRSLFIILTMRYMFRVRTPSLAQNFSSISWIEFTYHYISWMCFQHLRSGQRIKCWIENKFLIRLSFYLQMIVNSFFFQLRSWKGLFGIICFQFNFSKKCLISMFNLVWKLVKNENFVLTL